MIAALSQVFLVTFTLWSSGEVEQTRTFIGEGDTAMEACVALKVQKDFTDFPRAGIHTAHVCERVITNGK